MRVRWLLAIVMTLLASRGAFGQAAPPPSRIAFGGAALDGWSGLKPAAGGAAILTIPGETSFRYPDGPRGFHNHGFRLENDGTVDWTGFYGPCFEIYLTDDREVELTVTLSAAAPNAPDKRVASVLGVAGAGWHSLALPWSAFAFDQAGNGFLRFGKGCSIAARFTGGGETDSIQLRNVRLLRAPVVALACDVRGKAAAREATANYQVQVSNCTDEPQAVALSFIRHGWEVMDAAVEPASLRLSPGEVQTVVVRVKVSDRVPPGGHERQVLQAIPNGNAAAAQHLSFITTSELAHPYVLHTAARWQEVRDKVRHYAWAETAQDAYLRAAENWNVPDVAKPPANDPNDNYGPFVFRTAEENNLLASAFSWELTGNRRHAEKVAQFLRRLSDPKIGYPQTLRTCNQSLVQEGHFFQHVAMAYDIILDADVLSDADRNQIEATFRLLLGTIERASENGSINNWNLSEDCGAFYCALAMQDLAAADRFFAGPAGIEDQLAKGTMDDGWWYECSISYNLWCASEFTQAALAYEPFGFNFRTAWVPAIYSPSVMLGAQLSGGNGVESPQPWMKGKPFGMDPTLCGPTRRPYRTITDLWNSLLPFIDYRGVMFGVNDSTESRVAGNRTEVSGQPFEIAYYAYRDPRYAAIVKLGGGQRDMLYGVGDLPQDTPQEFRANAYADNVGLAMLRSQTKGRPMRQQIHAALHYGTHGWAHGHFDRTDLLCLMRYGRSFWNPESVFYGYEPFMYKFFTQTSVNHNMVVVDQKMQQATPGERLLFYTGSHMQAAAVQTTARWSNPPYGGMVYDYVPVKTFEQKTWREGRYVPIPTTAPAYGTLSDFTEPVLQRRLMIVTDDYVLLADYLKGERPHTFDNLLQIKGFLGLEGGNEQFLRHDAQWNPDPLGSAQFVTDCNWYAVSAPAVARFAEWFGPGVDEEGSRSIGNEPGVLKLDVHSLWPPRQQIMVATAPEQHNTEKRLFYTVRGDGKTLAQGQFGAWILGQGNIDVPLDGVKRLELQTKTELSRRPTLFWAAARITLRDGTQVPLSHLPLKFHNVVPDKGVDVDYLGGPVKIAGNTYKDDVPAEPADARQPADVTVDLTRIDAVRLAAVIGSDYPPGDESQRRKTYAIRSHGIDAAFLTLIEPYEDQPVVKSASATGPGTLRVELTDGRVQQIDIQHLDGDGKSLSINLQETKGDQILGTEICNSATSNP
jgi:hypothetical protein